MGPQKFYQLEHDTIALTIEMLLGNPTVMMENAEVVSAAVDQYRRTPSLGFSDCMLIEIARKAGHLPLGTFDRKLARLEGTERL